MKGSSGRRLRWGGVFDNSLWSIQGREESLGAGSRCETRVD